jgi:hypothetical protein
MAEFFKEYKGIPQVGDIYEILGDFRSNLFELKRLVANIVSPREEMLFRLSQGMDVPTETFTSASINRIHKKHSILTLDSDWLDFCPNNPHKLAIDLGYEDLKALYFIPYTCGYHQMHRYMMEDRKKDPSQRMMIDVPTHLTEITENKNFWILEYLAQDKELAREFFSKNGSKPIPFKNLPKNVFDIASERSQNPEVLNWTIVQQLMFYTFRDQDQSLRVGLSVGRSLDEEYISRGVYYNSRPFF